MVFTQLVVIGLMAAVAFGPGLGAVNREHQSAPFDSRDRPSAQGTPYEKLFTPGQKEREPFNFQFPRESSSTKADRQPRVVCGMVVVPVTPDLDPKMLVQPKNDTKNETKTEYKIRAIEPKMCNK